jgi:DNA-binding PadR family transcriptional regulator
MAKKERISFQELRVLGLLGEKYPIVSFWSGAEICRALGLGPGTIYPLLSRLAKKEWLRSFRETGDPHALGRPVRRFYTMTSTGNVAFKSFMSQLKR